MIISILDFIGTMSLLLALYLIPKSKKWWLLYAFACFVWAIIFIFKGLYFGLIMEIVALSIGIKNYWGK